MGPTMVSPCCRVVYNGDPVSSMVLLVAIQVLSLAESFFYSPSEIFRLISPHFFTSGRLHPR